MNRLRRAGRVARLSEYALAVAERDADVEPDVAVGIDEIDEGNELASWSGVIGVEGEMTGDGRFIEVNALRWASLPIPLRFVRSDSGAHDGAVVVGRINHIERRDNGDIYAEGDFDLASEDGREAARLVDEGLQNGVSMDLDEVSYELRLKGEVYDRMSERMSEIAEGEGEISLEYERDDEGRVVLESGSVDDEVIVTTDARVRAATLVSIPAFERTRITRSAEALAAVTTDDEIDDSADSDDEIENDEQDFNWVDDVGGLPQYIKRISKHLQKKGMTESRAIATAVNAAKRMCATGDLNFPGAQQVNPGSRAEACAAVADWEAKKAEAKANSAQSEAFTLVASAPLAPPRAWFENPRLDGPQPVRISKDGHIYGHVAAWGTCHTAYPGECVAPPVSASKYAYFHTGSILTAEGDEIAVGRITMDTLHAGRSLNHVETLAHYENTGRAAADVVAGEDAHGIWISGALRPSITGEKVRALRASPLSGDWRRIGGNLELVAALAVNVPGFPIPRTQGLVASGATQSLVASGMLAPEKVLPPGAEGAFSDDDLRHLQRLIKREREQQSEIDDRARSLARRVEAKRFAARVRRARRPFDPSRFAASWEKQRRVPKGHGILSGRWLGLLQMPINQREYDSDFRDGSAIPHLVPHPNVPGEFTFSPERIDTVHRPYIEASMKEANAPKDRAPRYTMMGGGPASGKSSVIRARRGSDNDLEQGRVIVNPDIAKTGGEAEGRPDIKGIPEYAERVASNDPEIKYSAAGYTHEESSYMAKELMQATLDEGFDVTNDGTGDSGYGKLASKVAQARAAGYDVEGQYVTVSTEEALVRAKIRGFEEDRMVSSTMLIGTHMQVSAITPEIIDNRLFDSFELWDTESGGEPRLLARYVDRESPVEIPDQEAYDAYLAKADDSVLDVLRRSTDLAEQRVADDFVPEFIKPEQRDEYRENQRKAAEMLRAELSAFESGGSL